MLENRIRRWRNWEKGLLDWINACERVKKMEIMKRRVKGIVKRFER